MTNNKKPYISPSQLSSYLRCGEAYRRRYVNKEIIPPAIAMVKGVAVHKGAEHNFKQKIESHQDLKKQEVLDVTIATFEEKIKHEGLFLSREEESIGKDKVIGEAKDSTARLSSLFIEGSNGTPSVASKYQPKEVEVEQKIILENSSHDLLGRIDLITDDNKILDLKTSSKTITQETVDKSDQFTFYAMTHRAKHGVDASGIIVENLVDLKKPKVETILTERNQDDYQVLINRINSVLSAINAGIFIPAPADSWACSPRFCGYWDTCQVKPTMRKIYG